MKWQALLATKENRQKFCIFLIFSVHGKNGLRWPQIGPRGFFPTNPDLADISGRIDLNFEIFYYFLFCWTPDFWISRSPHLQISGFPGPQISKFQDFQVPRFPDAAGRTLRSQSDPSPNAPRDQIRRKGPCCDAFLAFCPN